VERGLELTQISLPVLVDLKADCVVVLSAKTRAATAAVFLEEAVPFFSKQKGWFLGLGEA